MPATVAELERGSVCLALYPFTPGFPLEVVMRDAEQELIAELERHESIDTAAAAIRKADAQEVVVQVKIRRVLLLQSGTDARRPDVLVARISSISEEQKTKRQSWYRRLQSGIHPAAYLVGGEEHHGTGGAEAYVNLLSISNIEKAAILKIEGRLTEDEMREISELLIRTLEIDISAHLDRGRASEE